MVARRLRAPLGARSTNMNIEDKIRGVIYGQAIGDALGLSTEFMSKTEIIKAYPNGINTYEDIQTDEHTERWEKGDWTDDTDQMLCILDSIIEEGKLTVQGVSRKFKEWYNGEPMGIGNTVYNVLSDEGFLNAPHEVSKRVWKESGMKSAANGGVMRTSILGVWEYKELEKVEKNAREICKITHYDPRCIASCVAVSLAISELLKEESDMEIILNRCVNYGKKYDSEITEKLSKLPLEISELELDQYISIGYTYKALTAGFWVMKYSKSYEEGLKSIINEGGDADTNASVGGAILGAKFGYDSIPERLKTGLLNRKELEERIEKLLRMISCT